MTGQCDAHERIERELSDQNKVNFNHESRISKLEGWIKVNTGVVVLGFISILITLLVK